MSNDLKITCSCGATLELSSPNMSWTSNQFKRFLDAHKNCTDINDGHDEGPKKQEVILLDKILFTS